jgi:hypothetical protein
MFFGASELLGAHQLWRVKAPGEHKFRLAGPAGPLLDDRVEKWARPASGQHMRSVRSAPRGNRPPAPLAACTTGKFGRRSCSRAIGNSSSRRRWLPSLTGGLRRGSGWSNGAVKLSTPEAYRCKGMPECCSSPEAYRCKGTSECCSSPEPYGCKGTAESSIVMGCRR